MGGSEIAGFIKVKGSCMLPLFREGDVLAFKAAAFSSLKIGDITVIKSGEEFMVHRILDKFQIGNEPFIVHKGDNGGLPLVVPAGNLAGMIVPNGPEWPVSFNTGMALKARLLFIRIKLTLKFLKNKCRK